MGFTVCLEIYVYGLNLAYDSRFATNHTELAAGQGIWAGLAYTYFTYRGQAF